MNTFDYKTIEYLNLEIKIPENYNHCRRSTTDNNKLVFYLRENFKHKIYSESNNSNFEQLNTIFDLLCCLSENIKIKLNKSSDSNKTNVSENIIYLKNLLEDIFKKTREESKNQLETSKKTKEELKQNNKLLESILYGQKRT